jgi:CO/xanthine dehydrogenase FAD-binding subunit
MKPAAFEYHRATSLDHALELLAEYGDGAKVLAGGQSLIPAMNFRLANPAMLIDVNRLAELDVVAADSSGGLQIGALTRQRRLEREAVVADRAPLLAETVPFVAHPQIRNRGTVGGSLAHADPAAELPAVMVALDARFELASRRGRRWVSARDFFVGFFTTALEPDELLVGVSIPPRRRRAGFAFEEISRRLGDYAMAGLATVLELDEGGRIAAARMVAMSVGDGPVELAGTKDLVGETPSPEVARAAAAAAMAALETNGDIHASAEYRRHLVGVLVRRTVLRAAQRAEAAT